MGETARPLAIVTGASTGIGFELAKDLARRAHDLVIAAEELQIEHAATAIRDLGVSVNVWPVRADLASADGCATLIHQVEALGRPIEVVALNAGIGVGGEFAETSLDDELNLIGLNVLSTVRLAKWAVASMVARGRGRILITSSIAGLMPAPNEAIYGASKAFVLSFASSLHHELDGTGVVVTAMLPGPTDTEFFHRAGMEDLVVADEAKKNDPAEVARQGIDALFGGRERIVAGSFGVKLQEAVARFFPEGAKAKMHERLTQPKSKT